MAMGIIDRLLRRGKQPERDFLVAQVLSRHREWYPVHNRGREAPEAAIHDWMGRLRCLSRHELILLIVDNHARNRVLGKRWPPAGAQVLPLFAGVSQGSGRRKRKSRA
jgi:hypothetical protein